MVSCNSMSINITAHPQHLSLITVPVDICKVTVVEIFTTNNNTYNIIIIILIIINVNSNFNN